MRSNSAAHNKKVNYMQTVKVVSAVVFCEYNGNTMAWGQGRQQWQWLLNGEFYAHYGLSGDDGAIWLERSEEEGGEFNITLQDEEQFVAFAYTVLKGL